jgi:hypothetical protein
MWGALYVEQKVVVQCKKFPERKPDALRPIPCRLWSCDPPPCRSLSMPMPLPLPTKFLEVFLIFSHIHF